MLSTASSLRWANAWAEGATDIPAGLILSVCFVVTSPEPVYMTSISLADGTLSVVFSQDGEPIAYGNTNEGGSVLFLETTGKCLYASVELGALTGLSVNSTVAVRVNPSNVLVADHDHQPVGKVTVRQDGVTEESVLSTDHKLQIDPRLLTTYDEGTKTVKISLGAEEHRGLLSTFVPVNPAASRITSINHVRPNPEGFININISSGSNELTFDTSKNIPMITISSSIPPCDSVDVIDKHIAPTVVRNFAYLPLDDAYTEIDGKYVRDTVRLLSDYNRLDTKYDTEYREPSTSQNV